MIKIPIVITKSLFLFEYIIQNLLDITLLIVYFVILGTLMDANASKYVQNQQKCHALLRYAQTFSPHKKSAKLFA